jgi:polar amino acid transport system substrate-binding protein
MSMTAGQGVTVLLFSSTLLASTACFRAGETGDIAAVKARGKLQMICFPVQENASVYVNLASGPMRRAGTTADFGGSDVDLVDRFAKELGVALEIRTAPVPGYGELIPALLRGEGDLVASSFSITPERQKVVDFTVPYMQVHSYVYTRADSDIAKLDDLRTRVGAVVRGSNHYERLRTLGVNEALIKQVEFSLDGYLAVKDRAADYTIMERSAAPDALKLEPGFKVALEVGPTDSYGIAVRKGSDLKPALDAFITRLQKSGELAKILKEQ